MTVQDKRREIRLDRFINTKPKAVDLAASDLVEVKHPSVGDSAYVAIRPVLEDLNSCGWVRSNFDFINAALLEYGAIVFRDFDIDSVSRFEMFIRSFPLELMDYIDQHTPRTRVASDVYTSTEYPADHCIPFHSENSKNQQWPMKIWFFCLQPAAQGGETPFADNRRVFNAIDAKIRERFARNGVMYVRNFGQGLGLSWQTAFQTTSRVRVEEYCKRAKMDFEWRDGDRLRVRHICQSVARHPVTNEMLWFNQAHLFHVSSLEPAARESMLSIFKQEDLPGNSYYGDGVEIEAPVLDEIRAAFSQAEVTFTWRRNDILMLDNMLMAHGRRPYLGERKVLVAMAEPYHNRIFGN